MANKKKILIVDDEPDVVRWLTVLFENNGYEAISAYDGIEGFGKAETERPDLITLDISMPKESETTSGIPVIVLTGVSPEFERFISSRSQVNPPAAYVEKPVKDEELLEKVRELIG